MKNFRQGLITAGPGLEVLVEDVEGIFRQEGSHSLLRVVFVGLRILGPLLKIHIIMVTLDMALKDHFQWL